MREFGQKMSDSLGKPMSDFPALVNYDIFICTLGWINFVFFENFKLAHVALAQGGCKITCSNSEFFLSAPSIYANQLKSASWEKSA